MDGDLKWVLIAAAVIFFLSRLLNISPATSATASEIKNSASVYSSAPIVRNQIITTQILDSNGRVVQSRQTNY
jgi:hypothetical protein